jgi:hypothetical protein
VEGVKSTSCCGIIALHVKPTNKKRNGVTTKRQIKLWSKLLGLLLIVVSPACHDCDNACLQFVDADTPSPDSVTCRQGADSTCDLIAVDLIVTDVLDMFTVDFTFTFDPAVVHYENLAAEGSILSSDGAQVTILEDPQQGQVTITIARLGLGSGGIDAIGEQFLVRLYFGKAAESGSSSLSFTTTRMFTGVFPPEIIEGVEWSGGTLIIR